MSTANLWCGGVLSGVICCCGLSTAVAEVGAPLAVTQQVGIVLERMANALHTLNYEGTLVYLHDNQLETLSLLHRVFQGQVQERLISLSGSVRAVAREGERVLYAPPDGQALALESPGSGHILATEGIDPAALGMHYVIRLLGTARIAGRDTDVIGIIPRDALRYGYRFHIDRETALPLKSDLIDQQERPLEQLLFTNISLLPNDGSTPTPAAHSLRTAPVTEPSSRWRFSAVPPGFQLVMHRTLPQADGGVTEQFLFTDRLCAYSVYVEDASAEGLDGSANIGAVHAFGRVSAGQRLTAIGEVPAATVAAAVAGARTTGGTE